MGNYKFIGKPIDLFEKQTVGKCAFIAILCILMGSLLGYLAGEEQASFGKDFMTFYCAIFGLIAVVFIIKMFTDYQHLYDVHVLKHYKLEEAENTIRYTKRKLASTLDPYTEGLLEGGQSIGETPGDPGRAERNAKDEGFKYMT